MAEKDQVIMELQETIQVLCKHMSIYYLYVSISCYQ